jgi:hypothetical protein
MPVSEKKSKRLSKKVTGVKFFENVLAWHAHCDVYCGARETVGGSSVSVVAGVRTVATN